MRGLQCARKWNCGKHEWSWMVTSSSAACWPLQTVRGGVLQLSFPWLRKVSGLSVARYPHTWARGPAVLLLTDQDQSAQAPPLNCSCPNQWAMCAGGEAAISSLRNGWPSMDIAGPTWLYSLPHAQYLAYQPAQKIALVLMWISPPSPRTPPCHSLA